MQEDWEKKKVTDGLTEKVQPIYMTLPRLTCTPRNTGMFKFYRERFRAFTLWDCVSMKNVYMYWLVEFYINECMGKKCD